MKHVTARFIAVYPNFLLRFFQSFQLRPHQLRPNQLRPNIPKAIASKSTRVALAGLATSWILAPMAPSKAQLIQAKPESRLNFSSNPNIRNPSFPGNLTPEFEDESMVTIPNDSALVVFFPAELKLDPKLKTDLSVVLPLVQPLIDETGAPVVSSRSLVSVSVLKVEGGAYLRANAIIVGGRVIPVEATGSFIPLQNSPDDFFNVFQRPPSTLNNIASSLQFLTGSSNEVLGDRTSLALGAGFAVVNGLTTPAAKSPPPIINISQGAVHILTITEPVVFPAKLVQNAATADSTLNQFIPEPDSSYIPEQTPTNETNFGVTPNSETPDN